MRRGYDKTGLSLTALLRRAEDSPVSMNRSNGIDRELLVPHTYGTVRLRNLSKTQAEECYLR